MPTNDCGACQRLVDCGATINESSFRALASRLLCEIADNTGVVVSNVLIPLAPTFATVGVVSGLAVPANLNRRGLILTNTSANTISFGLGFPAVLSSGIVLPPLSVWVMDAFNFTTAAVNAIATVAASNLAIQEFE